MGAVKGAISIKDNMSAVLRSIKQEQSAFRRDVQRTRRELESTWDQRRTARLDATAANRTAQQLRQRLEPLRQKIVTANTSFLITEKGSIRENGLPCSSRISIL